MKTHALSLLAAAVLSLIAASGCRTFVPFTQEIRDQNHLSDAELKNLQFYVSSTITLRRELESGGRQVTGNHKLLVVAGKSIEEVVVEAKTPGICVGVGPHQLSVSFEQGTALDFAPMGARSSVSGGSAFAVAPSDPDPFPGNRGAELLSSDPLSGPYLVWVGPTSTVTFLGKPFEAVDDTSTAELLIDAQSLDQVVKQRKVLPGLRLTSR